MIRYENHCCSCAVPGYPCIGSACPNVNVPVYYCDVCYDDTYAEYEIEGEHFCESCAKCYMKEAFCDLTLSEQAEVLDIDMKRLEE